MAAEGLSVRIDFYFRLLPGLHVSQLRLFEIRRHPHILQRHHHQQSLPGLHNLPRLDLLVRRHAVHRRNHFRVTQIQQRCIERRARLRHLGHFRLRVRRPHAHLLIVRACSFHSRARLQHSRLCRVQLRLHDFHIPLRLRHFFLVRLQRAGCRIRIGLRRVILLLRNLALLHQRLVARQIRLRQRRIGKALVHVRLRIRQVRRLRLLIRGLRLRQVRLRSQQLRVRARVPTSHVCDRARHIHSRGSRFTFRQRQRCLGLVHRCLVIPRIDLHQHLARFHCLVVVHQYVRHFPVNLRRDRRDVPVDLRVIRAFAVVVVEEQSGQRRQQYRSAKNRKPPHLRVCEPLWRFLL